MDAFWSVGENNVYWLGFWTPPPHPGPIILDNSLAPPRETSRIHSNEAHSDTTKDSFMSLTSIIYICGMTVMHLCVWHGIGTREIHSYPGHDSFWCWFLRVEFWFFGFEFSRLPHIWVTEPTHNPLDDHFHDNHRKQEVIYWDFVYYS